MIERNLTAGKDSKWLTATFNPWLYSSVQAMQLGFFAELQSALPKDDQWRTARDKLGELGKKLVPLASLVPGVDLSGALDVASDALMGDTGVAETKKRAEVALRDLDYPILVILDDLDRLTPEELLFVFKLVRLVGRLPNVYYLLAFDEATMLDVLGRTDLVASNGDRAASNRARDYLEKIVQIRLDLPAFREAQARTMINRALDFVVARNGIDLNESSSRRLQEAFSGHLIERLNTPRAINRYFGQVDALYVLHGQEVDFVDFAIVTWLRTNEPLLYADLYRHKSDLTGEPRSLFGLDERQSPDEALAQWRDQIGAAGVSSSHLDGVMSLLGLLFLPIKSAIDRMSYAGDWLDEIADRRGVGHPEFFDRYFSFGVPDEDIADSLISEALAALSAGRKDTVEVASLASSLTSATSLACRKIARHVKSDPEAPIAAILTLMAESYSSIPGDRMEWLSPRYTLEIHAADLLPSLGDVDGPDVLARSGQTSDGIYFVAGVVARISHRSRLPSEGLPVIPWLARARDIASDLIGHRLEEIGHEPLHEIRDRDWQLAWSWHHVDHQRWAEWYRGQLASGRSLIDLVAKLVRDDWKLGMSPFPVLDMSDVDALLGLEYVLDSLSEELAAAVVPFPQPVTVGAWEERKLMAKELLRRAAEEREAPASSSD
jgi:hypothetical protein